MVSVITSACINNLAIQELNNKAESYMDKGDTETAICRLKSSLDLDNEIFQTHYNLAVAYNTIGNYDGAILEAKKVLELKPEFYDAYYIIAVAKDSLAYAELNTSNDNSSNENIGVSYAEFTVKAQDAIDTYNKYLEFVPNAVETEKINSKIAELNEKIKEFASFNSSKPKEQSSENQSVTDENSAEEPQ